MSNQQPHRFCFAKQKADTIADYGHDQQTKDYTQENKTQIMNNTKNVN